MSNSGLTQSEAEKILASVGYNEIPSTSSRYFLKILFEVIQEPMLILLISCGTLYLTLGEVHDGILLFFSVLIVISLTVYQESKAEGALKALKKLSSPRALVLRDSVVKRIPGREVVPGDLLVLGEGDRIAADATLMSSSYLRTDESLLTGEAFPVVKRPDAHVFSGTLVVGGNGIARVHATGTHTELGRIGRHLDDARDQPTALQRETFKLVRTFGALGLGFSALITVAFGVTRGDWPHAILAGIAAAMSLLPEELSVVMTIFLAVGASRISKFNVLTRKVSATENLGAITSLCVDKTGTLTLNQMQVHEVWEPSLTGKSELMKYAVLASHRNPYDPMEVAIRKATDSQQICAEIEQGVYQLVHEYPLSNDLLAMSSVWKPSTQDAKDALVIASKGAPEAIVDLCHLSEAETQKVLDQVRLMGEKGLRVLGVAKGAFSQGDLPSHPHDFNFDFLGLMGLQDPVRPGVAEAVQECYRAGIQILMMTGDYPATAHAIAHEIGLNHPDRIFTGEELRHVNDLELRKQISETRIFARMVPDQKLRIVNALKSNGEIVAMTGDGVNDAPSLKWADVGIAMGARGTDVAREAADIVLLDDNFASIVGAIRMGRRIFENIRKAMLYILSVHIPIAGMAIIPVILKMPLLLYPAHIVFLELIIDPACSLVFEAEETEGDLMGRPPRSAKGGIFKRRELVSAALQGLIMLALTLFIFVYDFAQNQNETHARAIAYTVLILGNLSLILVRRAGPGGWSSLFRKNLMFFGIAGGALAILGLILFLPAMQRLFQLGNLTGNDFAWITGLFLSGLVLCKITQTRLEY